MNANSPRSLALVGPMGAGKSTLGPALARTLGYEFVDVDAEIRREAGVDIPEIFSAEGEAGFRARERRMIQSLCTIPARVIATGGGCVETPANRSCLEQHCFVIYLRAQPETSWRRVGHSKSRPLLAVADPQATLQQLFSRREPLYQEIASLTIDVDKLNTAQVLKRIMAEFEPAGLFSEK
ncbi:MAG: shikimate kinase [Burkholderiales bacterium]|jgi:shikimate kinase|nr:shikimate kinase [Burkholderiales bacterium]